MTAKLIEMLKALLHKYLGVFLTPLTDFQKNTGCLFYQLLLWLIRRYNDQKESMRLYSEVQLSGGGFFVEVGSLNGNDLAPFLYGGKCR